MTYEEQKAFVESVDLATRQKDSKKMHVGVQYDERHYLNTRLAEGETKRTARIRILPITPEGGSFYAYVPVHFLYNETMPDNKKNMRLLCLDNATAPWRRADIRCPLCEKVNRLFEEARSITDPDEQKAKYKEAGSLKARGTYVIRVIDRDHEDEGPKFWHFNADSRGEGCYDKLMSVYRSRRDEKARNEGVENYNIFDIYQGCDIDLELTPAYVGSRKVTNIKISGESTAKPLCADTAKMNVWLNDPLRWYDIYGVQSREYMRLVGEGINPTFDKETGTFIPFVSGGYNNNHVGAPDEPTITVYTQPEYQKPVQQTQQAQQVQQAQPTAQQTIMPNVEVMPAEEDELPF
ncbi:MAG: hypothetical protein LUD72_08415 [Bacteroidales bacterium]|nr:hypothetical protein [Bacteroidales bacterium]